MQNINLVPVENFGMYSFKTPQKNIPTLRRFHQRIDQRSVKFLYEAKKTNLIASSFTISMNVNNKTQKIAYKVFAFKNDELCFEFSPQKLELNKWMIARDCTYDKFEEGGGKIWVGDSDKDKETSNILFHTFHCFRKYEDAVRYKKLVEFQRFNNIKSNLVIMPVEIDTSVYSQYEIIYLPYLDYAIFGVNTTLMYVDSNNIII